MVSSAVLMVSPTVLNTPDVLNDIHPVYWTSPGVPHRHYAGWFYSNTACFRKQIWNLCLFRLLITQRATPHCKSEWFLLKGVSISTRLLLDKIRSLRGCLINVENKTRTVYHKRSTTFWQAICVIFSCYMCWQQFRMTEDCKIIITIISTAFKIDLGQPWWEKSW